jgi:hypothetical protein
MEILPTSAEQKSRVIGHQPIEIGAGLVLGTYPLLIIKATLK